MVVHNRYWELPFLEEYHRNFDHSSIHLFDNCFHVFAREAVPSKFFCYLLPLISFLFLKYTKNEYFSTDFALLWISISPWQFITDANYWCLFCIYNWRGGLAEILCKPKILPLKSAVLEQLQKIEREIEVKEEGEEDVLNIRDHK